MMGFGSNGIETMTEFIEKARRAAVVDGGLPRSANPN
jgi:hypothetical protein